MTLVYASVSKTNLNYRTQLLLTVQLYHAYPMTDGITVGDGPLIVC